MEDRVNVLLQNVFNIDEAEAKKNLQRDDVYRWDSLTHMDLITTLEREFQVTLTLDDIIEMSNFARIRDIISSKTAE